MKKINSQDLPEYQKKRLEKYLRLLLQERKKLNQIFQKILSSLGKLAVSSKYNDEFCEKKNDFLLLINKVDNLIKTLSKFDQNIIALEEHLGKHLRRPPSFSKEIQAKDLPQLRYRSYYKNLQKNEDQKKLLAR